jgi:hypothetical protein
VFALCHRDRAFWAAYPKVIPKQGIRQLYSSMPLGFSARPDWQHYLALPLLVSGLPTPTDFSEASEALFGANHHKARAYLIVYMT